MKKTLLLFLSALIPYFVSEAQDTWSTKASLNVARSGGAAGVINGKLYVVGGTASAGTSLEVYDPATNTWTTLANMPTDRSYLTVAVSNEKLYVIGGCVGANCITTVATVEMYDPITNSWTTKAPMPAGRSTMTAAAIGNKIYVAGGFTSCGACSPISLLEIYDVTSNTWSSATPMPAGRTHVSSAVINGKFYVVGGSDGSSFQSSLYEYDPTGNTWSTKTSMNTPRHSPGVGVINNEIFVASGAGTLPLEVYNPATNIWTTKASIFTARYYPAAAAIGAVLYVAGSGSTNNAITTVEAFSAGLAPTIQAFGPISGLVGTTVTITGTNFSLVPTNNIVYFGATKAAVTSSSVTQLTVTVPSGARHSPITVTLGNLTAYSQKYFVPTFAGAGTITASSFDARQNFSTASSPWTVVVSDIDGNGSPELAAPNYTPPPNNVVSVFRNTSTAGNPSFATKVDFSCAGSPTSIALADFDGDGKTDVGGGEVNGLFFVYKNSSTSGTVSLTNRLDLTAPGALHGQAPGVGDLDNDGKPDFAGSDGTVATSFYVYRNTSTGGTISFASALPVTGAVGTMKMADFDEDGHVDIVSANGNTDNLSIFRNTTVGSSITFASKIDLTAGDRPLFLAIGDVDGDGKLDIATGNANVNNISVFRNQSTPGIISFAPKLDFTTGSTPLELDFGDLDGDGKIDLAVANSLVAGTISVLKNQSTSGTISFAPKVDFTSGPAPQGVAIADIDGDGAPEICINNNQENTVSVYRNLTTGGQWTTKASMTTARWGSGAGNINGTVYVAGGYIPTVHLSNHDAYTISTNSWAAKTAHGVQTNPAYGVINNILYTAGGTNTSVEISDLWSYNPTNDTWTAKTSLPAVRQASSGATVGGLLYAVGGRVGSTSLSSMVAYDPNANSWSTKTAMPTARFAASAGVINGLIYVAGGMTAESSTALSTLEVYDPASNTWTTKTAMPTARSGASCEVLNGILYVIGGLNAAGTVIATVEAYDPVANTWSAKAPLSFSRTYSTAVVNNGLIYVMGGYTGVNTAVAQVEEYNPGTLSVAVPTISSFTPTSGAVGTTVTITGTNFSTTPANNTVYFGATKASVTAAASTQLTVTVPSGATYKPISITVNGLTAYSSAPFIVTFPGGGVIDVNSFASKVDFTPGSSPTDPVIGDVDGDGKPDLVVANYTTSTVSVFRNTSASGSITASSFSSKVDFTTGTNPQIVAIGDVDGDGKQDLVVANYNSSSVSVFRNTSVSGSITASSFAARLDFTAGTNPYHPAIRDIDGDGKPDLVVTNLGSGNTVSVFRNTGTSGSITASSFASRVDFTTGPFPQKLAIGDIDGDGKPDVVVTNLGNNTVSVFRNTSTSGAITGSSLAVKVDFTTGTEPYDPVIGDIDGDGKPDLVVTNNSSSTVSVFRNTSTSGFITVGSFAPKVDFTTGTNPNGAAIGDVDGDGKPDLVVVNVNGSTVSVFRNTSASGSITTGSFASKVDFTAGSFPFGAAVGDVDGDGKPDLVVTSSNSISVLRNSSTADITAPTVATYAPADNSTGINVNADLVITFSEAIQKGTGNILIKESGTLIQTIPVSDAIVTVSGTTVSINPADFSSAAQVNVEMPAGTFKDLAGNDFAGITNATTWNFSVVDTTPPTVSTLSPTDNATNVSAGADLIMSFSEPVQKGTGNIVIRTGTTVTETIDVSTTAVTVSGNTVTINPVNNLSSGASVNVQMAAGVIKDISNNNYAGILDATTWNFTVATDGTPPTITDTTPTTYTAGATHTFSATIVDSESTVTAATVEWRSITAGGSTVIQNLIKSGNNYTSAGIGSQSIGELGLEYRISATSTGGTATTGATFKTVKVIPSAATGLTVPYSSFGSSVSNYRIVAVPLELTSKTVNSVFDELGPYDPEKWRMYRYDNGNTTELTGNTQMLPGQGFWLIVKNNPGNAINSGGGNSVNVTSAAPLEIDLKADWNQIGNPYNFNLLWADVQAANPGLPGLRIYNGSFADGTRLDKMQGGFVKVTSAQKLKFPVVKNASINSGRTNETEPQFHNALTEPNWQVNFTIDDGTLTNSISGFGMHENASLRFDAFDGFNMPRFFDEYLELNHSKREGMDFYSKEVVPSTPDYVWEFTIESTSKSGLVTLTWDNSYFGSNDRELYLWDVALQRAINMRRANSYVLDRTKSKSFRAIFGSRDFVKEKVAVSELVLHAPWPNPSAGDVTFSFTLPEAEGPHAVDLTVTDVMGRTFLSASDIFEGGYHEMTWRRSREEPAGIYFVSLKTGPSSRLSRFVLTSD